MRVLFVNRDPDAWMGGDAEQVSATCASLERLGVDTTFSCDPDVDVRGYDCVHLVHLNFHWTHTVAARCRTAGVPYVVSAIFNPTAVGMPVAAMRAVVERAHTTIALSETERTEIATLLGVDPERIQIVSNGVHPQEWPRGRHRNGPAIAFARVEEPKGLIHAARACREIGVPFVVFGTVNPASPYAMRLQAVGARLLGRHRQAVLATAARAASIYLCTSLTDRQSLAVLEAAQCGLPIVDSIHNRGASLLPSSLIVDPLDHDALVAAIRLQRAAPDNTDCVPTWDDVARQVLAIYPASTSAPAPAPAPAA